MHETPESCLDLMTLDFVQALETYTKKKKKKKKLILEMDVKLH